MTKIKFFKTSILFSALFGSLAQAQVLPELQDYAAEDMTKQSTEETNAALFYLYLAENNLAGKNTGICVDYYPHNQSNSTSRFKLAFNTSAFVTGKSELLAEQKEKVENVAKALNELSKISQFPLKAKVTGYADAQHYGNAKNIDESIQKNRDLALARASVIDQVLKTNASSCIFSPAGGVASDVVERRVFPKGLSWDQYRKVVLDIDLTPPQVSTIDGAPIYEVANARLSSPLARTLVEDELFSLLKPSKREVKENPLMADVVKARENLERFDLTTKLTKEDAIEVGTQTNLIFDRLYEQGKIVEECKHDTYLSLLTKIGIANIAELIRIGKKPGDRDNRDDPKTATSAQLYQIMRAYAVQQDSQMDTILPTITERRKGKPSDIFWCFKQGNRFFEQFFRETEKKDGVVVKAKTRFIKSGEQILKETGLNQKSPQFVQVNFNPETLDEQETQATFNRESDVNVGRVPMDSHHGFTCSQCKNGVAFHQNGRDYRAVYDSRLFPQVKAPNGTVPALELSTGGLSRVSKSPLSYGALAASQSYIFLQCTGCDCINSPQKLKQKLEKMDKTLVLNPFAQESARVSHQLKYEDFKNACIYNTPILNSCMVSPAQAQFEHVQDSEKLFEYPDAKGGRYKAASILEIAQKIKDSSKAPGVATLDQMQQSVRSVSCAENNLNLPTGDMLKDYLMSAR